MKKRVITMLHVIVTAIKDGFRVLNKNINYSSAVENNKKELCDVGINKLFGKNIVCFGDSIFGNARRYGITDFIKTCTGATVYNCAFGGARMAQHVNDNWTACSMFTIANCIAEGDYTPIYKAVNNSAWTSMPYYFKETEALIESIDFSKVNIVTISYGTNDFTGNVVMDNPQNKYDTTTLCGALRQSIESILGAYSNINIFVCLPTYRWWFDSSLAFTQDSDTYTNANSNTLVDFCNGIKNVANEYHLTVIDNYNIGINKFNRENYIPKNDGVHHNVNGRDLLARHIINELY